MEEGNGGGGVESHVMKVVQRPTNIMMGYWWLRRPDFLLRLMGLILTLIAAVVGGVDKQTKIIPLTVINTLPPLRVPVTAKWSDMSAIVYFVVANAVACLYAAISLLVVVVGRRRRRSRPALGVVVMDLHVMGVLFSATGAAAAVGVLGRFGNSHVEWKKVCNVFDRFCHHMAASLALSFLASLSFLALLLLSILNLHKKSTSTT